MVEKRKKHERIALSHTIFRKTQQKTDESKNEKKKKRMSSPEGMVGDTDAFPAVNSTRELNLGVPEEFPVDPISSEVATAKELKEEIEARAGAKAKADEAAKGDLGSTLMSVLMVSGVVVVAVGVAFLVTKKLKET